MITSLFLLNNPSELEKYLKLIFSVYNPIYLSVFIFIVLMALFYISYNYVYSPLLLKHRSEKEKLELKREKLLALFTELDPNPIVKIDPLGNIVGLNNSAKEKLGLDTSNVSIIPSLTSEFDINIGQLISDDKTMTVTKKLNEKFYEINIHGISLLKMAQLYFYDLTEKKDYEEQMHVYQKLLRDSSARLTQVLEEERDRFAGLLHDSIGQNLLFIKLGLLKGNSSSSKKSSSDESSEILELVNATLAEIKDIARNIRPLNIEELGLKTVLTSMCKNVSIESGIKMHLDLKDIKVKLSKELEICIYRVAQEALNNIIKHSRAKEFIVNLSIDDECVTLIISDDGIGFKPTVLLNKKYVSEGMGLLNMQERVERLNGTFHIDSSHDHGTVLLADFPINEMNNEHDLDYKNPSSRRS